MKFQWNPLEYGDALGLTRGPLSGRAPGKITDTGLDWQQKANPFISRDTLHKANDVAPYIAAAIATLGGSTAGEGAGAASAELPAGSGGAMDMGGSAGIFDSQGTPLYNSPAASTSAMRPQGMNMGGQQQPHMGPRPHDYLSYLQGQPAQAPTAQPLGSGTFWGPQQGAAMKGGLFGLGNPYG